MSNANDDANGRCVREGKPTIGEQLESQLRMRRLPDVCEPNGSGYGSVEDIFDLNIIIDSANDDDEKRFRVFEATPSGLVGYYQHDRTSPGYWYHFELDTSNYGGSARSTVYRTIAETVGEIMDGTIYNNNLPSSSSHLWMVISSTVYPNDGHFELTRHACEDDECDGRYWYNYAHSIHDEEYPVAVSPAHSTCNHDHQDEEIR